MDSEEKKIDKEEMLRNFKGIWIPKEIWFDDRISSLEKIVLMEIDRIDTPKNGCRVSNEYLASFCNCSERAVSGALSNLKNLGYIYVESFDGRTRRLRSRVHDFATRNYEEQMNV